MLTIAGENVFYILKGDFVHVGGEEGFRLYLNFIPKNDVFIHVGGEEFMACLNIQNI